MPIITFNASTEGKNKDEFSEIKEPYQIMPGGRSKLSAKLISQFPECQNENVLIHVSYITRPFSDASIFITRENLKHYAALCERLGTKDILIHLPTNVKEYSRFGIGLELILDTITSHKITCNFEIAVFTRELREYLEMTKENAFEKVDTFVSEIFEQIPKDSKHFFRFTPDTAHLFANGIAGKDMIKFIDKYKSKTRFLHLNGVKSPMFSPDKHIPIYKSNKIENVNELMKYLKETSFTLITENSTEKGKYEEWASFAKKYSIPIVKNNVVFMV